MIAAIYARKSTDEPGRAKDQKSVERQQELALDFAAKCGWTVPAEFIYVDDDISGAEFKRRPELQRMLATAKSRAPFQRLIVSEQKSIGREMTQTQMVITDLARAGVEIFSYDGQSLTPKNYVEKMMGAFRAGADEAHREDTAKRVHEAHARSVNRGYVVGGRVFGYRNRKVFLPGTDLHGNALYSHTERVIEPAEAAVVKQIFHLYDSGLGLKAVSKRLTAEGAVCPIPFIRRDPTKVLPVKGWSPSTVGAILGAGDLPRRDHVEPLEEASAPVPGRGSSESTSAGRVDANRGQRASHRR